MEQFDYGHQIPTKTNHLGFCMDSQVFKNKGGWEGSLSGKKSFQMGQRQQKLQFQKQKVTFWTSNKSN